MKTVPGPTDHVVVVGAGLSGLSAALHLLGSGRQVTVVERDTGPGGRAGRLELGGFRADTGPTVLTTPHLADEAFAAVGDSLYRRVELVALCASGLPGPLRRRHPRERPHGRGCHGGRGTSLRRTCRGRGYRRLRVWLGRSYRAQMRGFIDTNFGSPFQLLNRTWPGWPRWAASDGWIRRSAGSSPTSDCAGCSPSRRSTRG